MPSIDAGRTIADLRRLAAFGAYKTGVHRPTYSPQDVAARHWIAERMREAGLVPVIDGIGNVIGRSPVDGPRLLIGSHSESQNHAGWLDGALGVVYGLEVARAVREDPACAGLAIDVVSFADASSAAAPCVGSSTTRRSTGWSTGRTAPRCVPPSRMRASPAGGGRRLNPIATRAFWRPISSRATISKAQSSGSASSRASWPSGNTASISRASRTTPAPPVWRCARMPVSPWCASPAPSTGVSRRLPVNARCGLPAASH